MIEGLIGKPRNGKGLYAVRRGAEKGDHVGIVSTLVYTKRFIVTNMVLRLDVIQYALDGAGYNIHVRDRILMFDPEEDIEKMRNFWLYRAHGLVLERPDGYESSKGGLHVDYSPLVTDPRFFDPPGAPNEYGETPLNLHGTAYFIDECNALWPARGCMGTNMRHADFYSTQHGKLNDWAVFTSQNTKLVDPNFWRLAQSFTYCVNHRLQKFGRFRGKDGFTAKTYQQPQLGTPEPTMNEDSFKLDDEFGGVPFREMYDTSAGVGMRGGATADKAFRVKGFSLRWIWAGIGVAICAVYWVFNYALPEVGQKYFTSAVTMGSLKPGAATAKPAPAVPPSSPKPAEPAGKIQEPVFTVATAKAFEGPVVKPIEDSKNAGVRVRGVVRTRGGQMNVLLSDGRVLTEKGPPGPAGPVPDHPWDVVAIDRSYVTLRNGERLYMAEIQSRAISSSVVNKNSVQPGLLEQPAAAPYTGESAMPPSPGIDKFATIPSVGGSALKPRQASKAVGNP